MIRRRPPEGPSRRSVAAEPIRSKSAPRAPRGPAGRAAGLVGRLVTGALFGGGLSRLFCRRRRFARRSLMSRRLTSCRLTGGLVRACCLLCSGLLRRGLLRRRLGSGLGMRLCRRLCGLFRGRFGSALVSCFRCLVSRFCRRLRSWLWRRLRGGLDPRLGSRLGWRRLAGPLCARLGWNRLDDDYLVDVDVIQIIQLVLQLLYVVVDDRALGRDAERRVQRFEDRAAAGRCVLLPRAFRTAAAPWGAHEWTGFIVVDVLDPHVLGRARREQIRLFVLDASFALYGVLVILVDVFCAIPELVAVVAVYAPAAFVIIVFVVT